jgi:hypothetical protein
MREVSFRRKREKEIVTGLTSHNKAQQFSHNTPTDGHGLIFASLGVSNAYNGTAVA